MNEVATVSILTPAPGREPGNLANTLFGIPRESHNFVRLRVA